MTRVGVLGGTFDPPHLGHLRAAEVARDVLALDEVLFVPAAEPPHKTSGRVSRAARRLEMVELAVAGRKGFRVSPLELERGGASYTIETLEELHEGALETAFVFVTGSDAFREIRTWRRWEELLETYSFAVHERPGDDLESAAAVVPDRLRSRLVEPAALRAGGDGIAFLRRPMLYVSSTELRGAVGRGESIAFLVPDAVEAYIRQNRLYTLEEENSP